MALFAVLTDYVGTFSLKAADLIDSNVRDPDALRAAGVQLFEIPAGKEDLAASVLKKAKDARRVLGPIGENDTLGALVSGGVIDFGSGAGTVSEITGNDLDISNPTGPVVNIDASAIAAAASSAQSTADSKLASVQSGTNITVDDTDPQNPIINAGGGGIISRFSESTVSAGGEFIPPTGPPALLKTIPIPAEAELMELTLNFHFGAQVGRENEPFTLVLFYDLDGGGSVALWDISSFGYPTASNNSTASISATIDVAGASSMNIFIIQSANDGVSFNNSCRLLTTPGLNNITQASFY